MARPPARCQRGGAVEQKKKSLCMLCGKPSPRSICETCSARVQGEAMHKKKKEDKVKE
jgi:hypothetical protein